MYSLHYLSIAHDSFVHLTKSFHSDVCEADMNLALLLNVYRGHFFN